MSVLRLVTPSVEETRRLGRELGAAITGPVSLFLDGPLGAGKTCLVQGLAAGLEVPADEPVTSPSYTLMNPHRGRFELYHFDLYRLAGPEDLLDLGVEDYLGGTGVTVVEWASRVPGLADEGLWIAIEGSGEGPRALEFSARGKAAEELLARFRDRWPIRGEGT